MSNTKIDFAPGGQAVIEGVLMRSPTMIAIAVRTSNGSIVIDKRPYRAITEKFKILGLPFIRGMIGIAEMMIIGFKALNFSATVFTEIDHPAQPKKTGVVQGIFFSISLIFALALSLFFFKFVPLAVTTYISNHVVFVKNHFFAFNLIDGTLKMSIFIGYIALMYLSPDMKRVFQYHGAEHKAVYTYEKKLPLTPENAHVQSRFHPRCGTSFIMIVIFISIISYTILPRGETFLANFLMRVLWLPVIGGVAYEFLKLSAKNMEKAWVRILIAPGLWFQRLTTQEPDKHQLEVALRALESTIS